jgi:hypothetical protein
MMVLSGWEGRQAYFQKIFMALFFNVVSDHAHHRRRTVGVSADYKHLEPPERVSEEERVERSGYELTSPRFSYSQTRSA